MNSNDWAPIDELTFLQLQERRERVHARRRKALEHVVSKVWPAPTGKLIEGLINVAEELRDALQPYDSGVRTEAEKTGVISEHTDTQRVGRLERSMTERIYAEPIVDATRPGYQFTRTGVEEPGPVIPMRD